MTRTTTTTLSTTCAYFTATVMTLFMAKGACDKGPYPEEPREGKSLTRGSGVAAGWATAPPTIT